MKQKNIWRGKRYLALFLAAVLAFGLCACGETGSGSGGKDNTSSNAGNAPGDGSGAGMNEGNSGSGAIPDNGGTDDSAGGLALDGRVFWVEAELGSDDHTSPDFVTIYLRDEAVNQLAYDQNGQERNYIQVRFLRGDVEELSCLLNVVFWEYQIPGKEPLGQPNDQVNGFSNNTFSWAMHGYGLLDGLKGCDHVIAAYYDNADPGAERTIFELRDSLEVAALFEKKEEAPVLQANENVQLGFDGNFVSVRLSGDEHLKLGEGYAQRLILNKEGGMYEDGIHITFSFRGDGTFFGEDISGFQYESDGWVLDAGWTAKQAPLFLWHEDDGESLTVWYYAPGFREALEGMDTYWLGYDTDTNQQRAMQCEGSIAEIMGDYAAYKTPVQALSAEFLGEAKAGDEKYFTPLTPYYTVTRYDYPEVPRTTNWGWKLVDSTHMSYAFMSMDLDVTSVTGIVLSSYNSLGEPVQHRFKYIYEDEESAIRTNVDEHQALQTAEIVTYGTEEDFAQWIYDRFTGKTGGGDRAEILLSHEGNVVYTSRSIQGAHENLNFANGKPNVTETGSFAYSYSYGPQGGGNEIIRESTYTYKVYRTFDREQVTEAAQKPQ